MDYKIILNSQEIGTAEVIYHERTEESVGTLIMGSFLCDKEAYDTLNFATDYMQCPLDTLTLKDDTNSIVFSNFLIIPEDPFLPKDKATFEGDKTSFSFIAKSAVILAASK